MAAAGTGGVAATWGTTGDGLAGITGFGVGAVEPVVEPRSDILKLESVFQRKNEIENEYPSVEWTDAAELKKLDAALVSGWELNMDIVDWGTTG